LEHIVARGPHAHDCSKIVAEITPRDPTRIPLFREAILASGEEEREFLIQGLARNGYASVPLFTEFLKSEEAYLRKHGAEGLVAVGPEGSSATADLLSMLDDPDLGVRVAAIEALGRIGSMPGACVPALRALLRDRQLEVRRAALLALGRFGERALGIHPDLEFDPEDLPVPWEWFPLTLRKNPVKAALIWKDIHTVFSKSVDEGDRNRLFKILRILLEQPGLGRLARPFLAKGLSFHGDEVVEKIEAILAAVPDENLDADALWSETLLRRDESGFSMAVAYLLRRPKALPRLRVSLLSFLREESKKKEPNAEIASGVLLLLSHVVRPEDAPLLARVFEIPRSPVDPSLPAGYPGERWNDDGEVYMAATLALSKLGSAALEPLLSLSIPLDIEEGAARASRYCRALTAWRIANALPSAEKEGALRRLAAHPDPFVKFFSHRATRILSGRPGAQETRSWREGDIRVTRRTVFLEDPIGICPSAVAFLPGVNQLLLLTEKGKLFTFHLDAGGNFTAKDFTDLRVLWHERHPWPMIFPEDYNELSVSPDGKAFAAGGGDQEFEGDYAVVFLYQPGKREPFLVERIPITFLQEIQVDGPSGTLAALDYWNRVRWFRFTPPPGPKWTQIAQKNGGYCCQKSATLLPDGQTFVVSSHHAGLQALHPQRPLRSIYLSERENRPQLARALPDGTVIFLGRSDEGVLRLDPRTGKVLWRTRVKGSADRIEACEKFWVAFGGRDVILGRTEDGSQVGCFSLAEEGRAYPFGDEFNGHRVLAFEPGGCAFVMAARVGDAVALVRFLIEEDPGAGDPQKVPSPVKAGAKEPRIEGKSLGEWIEQLKSGDSPERDQAARHIGWGGSAARSAIPVLLELLDAVRKEDYPDPEFRCLLTWALGRIGRETLPHLTALLADEAEDVRAEAARSLGRMGRIGDAAISKLVKALKDERETVRMAATEALGYLETDTLEVLKALVGGLANPEGELRKAACLALEIHGKSAVPVLHDAIEGAGARQFVLILEVLSRIGKEGDIPEISKETVGRIARDLTASDAHLRRDAARALGRMGQRAAPVMEMLLFALKDRDQEARLCSIEAIGRIGPACKSAVSHLREELRRDDALFRRRAAQALARFGPGAHEALPALVKALKDSDFFVRAYAEEALRRIGNPACEPLLETLRTKDLFLRERAVHALSLMGAPAVPALRSALAEKGIQGWVAVALGRMGPSARAAAPVLQNLVDDEDPWVAACAAWALEEIGKEDR
jgi:HEAT repeat protein